MLTSCPDHQTVGSIWSENFKKIRENVIVEEQIYILWLTLLFCKIYLQE